MTELEQVTSEVNEEVGSETHIEDVVESAPTLEPQPKKRRRKKMEIPVVQDNRCPACVLGHDLAKGEGKHILGTDEHPILTAAPEKVVKQSRRPMAKELRGAQNFAEKMLPKKIAEKAKLMAEIARCDAEIQEYTRVMQALGGHSPVGLPVTPGIPSAPVYQPLPSQSYGSQGNQSINSGDPLAGMRIAGIPAILQGTGPAIDDKGWV